MFSKNLVQNLHTQAPYLVQVQIFGPSSNFGPKFKKKIFWSKIKVLNNQNDLKEFQFR